MTDNQNRPSGRPKCHHGRAIGGFHPCPDCYKEACEIERKIQPLVDEFWSNRGQRDLLSLFNRAYRMGMQDKNAAFLAANKE